MKKSTNTRKKKDNLGNPLVIAAAAKAVADPAIRHDAAVFIERQQTRAFNVAKVAGVVIVSGAAAFLGYRGYKKWQQSRLYKEALTNNNVALAIQLYDLLPDGAKRKSGLMDKALDVLSLGLKSVVEDAIDFFSADESAKILSIANKIDDVEKVDWAFKTLYGTQLIPIMKKALSPADFSNFLNSAKMDKHPLNLEKIRPADAGKMGVATQDTKVYWVATTRTEGALFSKAAVNKYIVPKGAIIGEARGQAGKGTYMGTQIPFETFTATANGKTYLVFVPKSNVKLITRADYAKAKSNYKTWSLGEVENQFVIGYPGAVLLGRNLKPIMTLDGTFTIGEYVGELVFDDAPDDKFYLARAKGGREIFVRAEKSTLMTTSA